VRRHREFDGASCAAIEEKFGTYLRRKAGKLVQIDNCRESDVIAAIESGQLCVNLDPNFDGPVLSAGTLRH
jgi:hypothetical protein